jgi:AraC family transcriptional regulator, regulatory protein of adaptative response / DNA-3-methyladenine glycosylase II
MNATPAPLVGPRRTQVGHHDNRFLVGWTKTGTYSLPSCPVLGADEEEPLIFLSEVAARAAGLRPCRVCKPDEFYRSVELGVPAYETLFSLVARSLSSIANIAAAARLAKISVKALDNLTRDHAHAKAQVWLRRLRVERAAELLQKARATPFQAGAEAGFEHEVVFERAFFQQMRLTPAHYAKLGEKSEFILSLPTGYRPDEVLSYHGRDRESPSERVVEKRLLKALMTPQGVRVVDMEIASRHARVRVHGASSTSRETMRGLHTVAVRMLGLQSEIAAFERQHPALVKLRKGLRVPLLPSAYEALVWAVTGQQINLRFASALRRELIRRSGVSIGDMRAHPTPGALAALEPNHLTALRFSRNKARYLVNLSRAIHDGSLDVESLNRVSAVRAEQTLVGHEGVGRWTARYVLMRTGFADSAPVGDSALATALARLHHLEERPDATRTAQLMRIYAPNRSLASVHLWATL